MSRPTKTRPIKPATKDAPPAVAPTVGLQGDRVVLSTSASWRQHAQTMTFGFDEAEQVAAQLLEAAARGRALAAALRAAAEAE